MKRNRLLRKFTFAYCLMIILPSMVLFSYIYSIMMNQIRAEYIASQTKLMDEAVATVETKLAYIEKAAESIQFSQTLLDTLENTAASDMDIVYNYVSEIQNLFSNVINYNSSLRELRIYSSNRRVTQLLLEFVPYSEQAVGIEDGQPHAHWVPEVQNGELTLCYYTPLLNRKLSRTIATLRLQCGSDILEPVISWRNDTAPYALYSGERLIYSSFSDDEQVILMPLTRESPARVELDLQSGLMNTQFYFDTLGLQIAMQTRFGAAELYGWFPMIPVMLALLLFIGMSSLIFFFVIYRPMRDITRLTSHIRSNAGRTLEPYQGAASDDEIGELVHSYNRLVDSNNDMIHKTRRSDSLRKNAQLSALQAQIDPHFFYGTLESIHMIAEANNQPLISEISLDFSMLMRYSLSKKTAVRLSEEITIVQQYLNIQQKRLGDRFLCDWSIELDETEIVCPKFILQPLVENVVVHSVSRTRKPVHISIRIWRQGEDVRLSVSDDGPGIEPERLRHILELLSGEDEVIQMESDRNGRGIFNIHRRLQLYYGSEYRLHVESVPFVRTTFVIAIKPTFDEVLREEDSSWRN